MKKIISIIALFCVMAMPDAYAVNFSEIEIKGNPEQINTSEAVFGDWSFFVTDQFYERDTYTDKNTYKYFEEAEMIKKPAVFSGIYTPVEWEKQPPEETKAGLIIASDKGNGNNNNERTAIEVYPGKRGDDVKFITCPRVLNARTPISITSCFTVPENGFYKIHTLIENHGWKTKGVYEYGGENLARVSILMADETKQTVENSQEFEITKAGSDKKGYESGILTLSKGDRIYLEVFNGNNGENDNFIGFHRIHSCDEEGNILKTFSLGDVSFSDTGEWNFFKSAEDNMNTNLYIPMYAAKPLWLTNSRGATGGYAAVPYSDWISGKIGMPKTPAVVWNEKDNFFTAKPGKTDDVIISKDILNDGDYIIKISAENTGNFEISDGSMITVSHLIPTNNMDTDVIGKIDLPESSSEQKHMNLLKTLSKGDRVVLRVNKKNSALADEIKIEMNIYEAPGAVNTKFMTDEKEIFSISELAENDILKAQYKYMNYNKEAQDIVVFAALYDENDIINKVLTNPSKTVPSFGETEFYFELGECKNFSKVVIFAWDSFMNPKAISEMAVLE